jgi:hypothetical protein
MKVSKIYLDNCCFNRPFDNQEQMRIRLETEAKLYIQAGVKDKRYSLGWSYMLDFENNENPYGEKREAIIPWKSISDIFCGSSDAVLVKGQEIMELGMTERRFTYCLRGYKRLRILYNN